MLFHSEDPHVIDWNYVWLDLLSNHTKCRGRDLKIAIKLSDSIPKMTEFLTYAFKIDQSGMKKRTLTRAHLIRNHHITEFFIMKSFVPLSYLLE